MDEKVALKIKAKKGITNFVVNTWEQVLTKKVTSRTTN